jgi:hypothetical protein
MENNLGESFQKLMEFSFPRYKGKVIERLSDGFMVFSNKFNTWEEATNAVDKSLIEFPKSINRLKNE